MWNFRDREKDPEIQARVHYSLAWYELNKRGTGIERAIEYDQEGIRYAKRTANIHLEAIGNHYLGDAFFRQGNLPEAQAHLEYALGHYQVLHYARRGEASYLLGRIFAYFALQAAMSFDQPGWRQGIARVESCFNDAEAALSNASQLQGSQISAYQRKQLLVEMAKWGPIDLAVREKLSRQGFTPDRLDNPGRVIARARSFLSQADQISYGMELNYYSNAVIVNNLLIDFVQWYARLSNADEEWQSLEVKVAREIRRLEATSLKDNIDLPDGTALIDTVLDGHMARLLAMLGVIRLKQGLDGEQSGIADIRKCADLAAKDFPTMMDCRWMISLSSNKDVLADFDSRLNRERLKMLK